MGMKQNNTTNQGVKMKIKRVFAGMYEGTAQATINGKIEEISFSIENINDYTGKGWMVVSNFDGMPLSEGSIYQTMGSAKKAIGSGQWVYNTGLGYCWRSL